eukprot:3940300-Rhodomonas_salina.1
MRFLVLHFGALRARVASVSGIPTPAVASSGPVVWKCRHRWKGMEGSVQGVKVEGSWFDVQDSASKDLRHRFWGFQGLGFG